MTTVTDADEARALELFDAALGDMGSFAEWGTPSYRDGALRTISAALAAHRQAAILEGMEIMREAAIDWLKAMDGFGEWWEAAHLIQDNLDPAAILSEHARRKAMDELIAGDADLYDGPPVV